MENWEERVLAYSRKGLVIIMINTYFIHIAAIRMAAKLKSVELYDNYAFHGALKRFEDVKIGKIEEVDGIPDVPQKADSFIFGQKCGKVINEALAGYSEKELLSFEAEVAKGTFLKLTPEATAKYTNEELKESLKTVFRALLKRAQIRTHTAKPGGEDINAWLTDYNNLLGEYEPTLSAIVEEIVAPAANNGVMFFDKTDKIITLALSGKACESSLKEAMEAEPVSVFGRILLDLVK